MKLKKLLVFCVAAVTLVAAVSLASGCAPKEEAPKADTTMSASDTGSAVSEPFWTLLIGNDCRKGTVEESSTGFYGDNKGRSDVIMLVRVDPAKQKVALVTIPRDTTCKYKGETVKINETYHQGGVADLKSAIKDLTGVDVKYYFDMGFVDYQKFVNSISGITANVPIDMQLQDIVSGDNIELSAGDGQTLNGAEALVLARQRKQYADWGDVCRQMQNRAVVQGMIERVSNDSANKDLYITALYAVSKSDFPKDELADLIDVFGANASKLSFVSGTCPYDGDMNEEAGLWLTTRDEATCSRVIKAAEEGKDPSTIVRLPKVAAK